jgi:hypothetical protein
MTNLKNVYRPACILLSCLLVSISSKPASAELISVATLINEIIEKPGAWNQMCRIPGPYRPTNIPLFGYYRDETHSWISTANIARLRLWRSSVIEDIEARMSGATPKAVYMTKSALDSHIKPEIFADPDRPRKTEVSIMAGDAIDHYLVILLDLNAIEALPTLLKFEKSLNEVAVYTHSKEHLNKLSKVSVSFNMPRYHTRTLSLITVLLLNEQDDAFMRSPIFGKYVSVYPEIRDEINEREARYQKFIPLPEDPATDRTTLQRMIVHDRFTRGKKLEIEMTQENRDLIIKLATDFLATTKPSEYRGATTMTPEITHR